MMSIESALCYAVFLAMRSKVAMVISGDRTAWNPDWGYLTDLSQFPHGRPRMPRATAPPAADIFGWGKRGGRGGSKKGKKEEKRRGREEKGEKEEGGRKPPTYGLDVAPPTEVTKKRGGGKGRGDKFLTSLRASINAHSFARVSWSRQHSSGWA